MPPPDEGRRRKRWPWAVGLGVLAVLVVAAEFGDEQIVAPADGGGPAISGAPAARLPAVDLNLGWRDYVLLGSGRLVWDGSGESATLSAQVVDANTRQPLGSHQLNARVSPNGAGQWRFATQVPVPGDSSTPGAHTHDINLILQLRPDGSWLFLKNCWTATQCL